MKRYILFCFETYYPGGGWNDYKGAFNTIEEAFEHMSSIKYTPDNYQIVDIQTGKVVREG